MATKETTTPHISGSITSAQISRYAEITSLISGLEAQKETLRSTLLDLHRAGAQQETSCPYLLAFIDQERRTVDWKNQALALAEKLYGIEKVASSPRQSRPSLKSA
jgi:hypothetical protein